MDLSLLYGADNISFFDSYWVAVHFVTGILLGLLLLRFIAYLHEPVTAWIYTRYGFVCLLVWEYFEVVLRYFDQNEMPIGDAIALFLPKGFFEIESTMNIVSDLIVGSVGLYLAYRFRKTASDRS